MSIKKMAEHLGKYDEYGYLSCAIREDLIRKVLKLKKKGKIGKENVRTPKKK